MPVSTTNVALSGGNANPGAAGSIRGEFGPAAPAAVSMSSYYRGGARVPAGTATSVTDGTPISTSGLIRMGMFRGTTNVTTAWTSSVALGFARGDGRQVGPFNNIFIAGGAAGGSAFVGNVTFNGTTWSTNASVSFPGRTNGGACGSSTDYIFVAGMQGVSTFQNVYRWNGTAWSTSVSWDFFASLSGHAVNGAGFSDARQVGDGGGGSRTFNGTSWTAAGTLVNNRRLVGGGGSSSNGVATAGTISGTSTATTEKNSGNTFSSAGSMAAARVFHQSCGASSSAILAVGGNATFGASTSVESGNGTAWTTAPSLNTARYWAQVSGTTTAAFCTGGVNSGGTYLTTTERYQ